MSDSRQTDRLPLLGGWTRNLAALMVAIGVVVLCLTAHWTTWPLGRGFIEEGSITTIRMALSVLALGVLCAVGFLAFFMFDIVVRLKRLDERLAKLSGRPDVNA
jgi:hypothetical protein